MQKKPIKSVQKKIGIEPLGDRVLLKPYTVDEARGEKKKNFGIIIPDSVREEKSAQGKVLAVGEGKYMDGKLIPVKVKVGDVVLFSKYSYDEVEYEGEEYYLLKEDNIFAIIR
jgi:chaperonin GroES